ncbi:hypothetical protein D3C81_1977120 [compost metagenome]
MQEQPSAAWTLHQRTYAFSPVCNEIYNKMIIPDFNILVLLDLFGECADNLIAGSITISMQDTAVAVRCFLS